MATFKRVNEQETRQLKCYAEDTLSLKSGDVVSFDFATETVAKCTDASEVAAAATDKQIYIIAQSDAVTDKTGTGYKEYKISNTVVVDSDSSKRTVIVGYLVKDVTNIEF